MCISCFFPFIQYYLVNDTLEVREAPRPNDGRDPFPVLIARSKVPKDRYNVDTSFPGVVMELSSQEIKVIICIFLLQNFLYSYNRTDYIHCNTNGRECLIMVKLWLHFT